ncbi:ABC transporter permease, partial [Thermophilibacter provencensis]|uniref:ABC transporter permease n=1 Tax=Thermophilibacter provencensis TaxID=1852386 RepID=UPI003AA8DBF7
ARRAVSGTSRLRQLAGCVLGAWAVSTVALTLAFVFLRLVVGVDFGGREGLALVAVAVCALLATALGACVGALPIPAGISARSGILTALTCVLSLFAGLYGTAAMELADNLSQALPWTSWVNPTKLVCDTFYALYYYTSLAPFAARVAACVAGALALLAVAGAIFRRQSYEHL